VFFFDINTALQSTKAVRTPLDITYILHSTVSTSTRIEPISAVTGNTISQMLLRPSSRIVPGLLASHALRFRAHVSRPYSSSKSDEVDIDAILAKPSWSVKSLLPSESAIESSTVTPKQLHHLLRLSALPQPASKEEEDAMLRTLESQIHFVKEIQSVDATGVEPLQAIRDETAEAIRENTIGLEQLKETMAKERVVGRSRRIHRVEGPRNDRPDGDAWDGNALDYASRTKGKFFVVETGNGSGN
jgi:Asp-tRNA(Asn)/Glu-tRNA(Gln) amidotransferase C subunit